MICHARRAEIPQTEHLISRILTSPGNIAGDANYVFPFLLNVSLLIILNGSKVTYV